MDTTPHPAPSAKSSNLAIWSLVLGILGLVLLFGCIGILFAIPAVICGHVAYGRIKRSSGMLSGESLAMAGLIIGYVSIAFSIVLIPLLAAIAIPNFVKARDVAQRNVCINNLRMIDAAKQQWALENKKSEYDVPTPEDLEPYIKGGFASLHCPKDGIYTINRVGVAPSCSVPEHILRSRSADQLWRYPSSDTQQSNPLWRANSSNSFPRLFTSTNVHFYPSTNQLAELREKNRCAINQLMIKNAKRIWALRTHQQPDAFPTVDDLLPFLPNHKLPVCPAGGTYTFGAVSEDPACSIPDHVLPGVQTNNPAASPK